MIKHRLSLLSCTSVSLRFLLAFAVIGVPARVWGAESPAAAEVNGVPITRQRLSEERRVLLPVGEESLKPAEIHDLEVRVLERLIERELLFQEAKKRDIAVTDAEVRKLVDAARAEFPTEDGFRKKLAEARIDEKRLSAGLRIDLTIEKLLDKEVLSRIEVTPAEVREAYDKNKDALRAPEEVRARQIFFKLPQSAEEKDAAAVQKTAEHVLAEARANPAQFASLAKRYSDGPAKGNGGDLGFFTRNQMPEAFSTAVFELKPGEMSEVIRTDSGFHIALVEEKRGGELPGFEDVQKELEQKLRFSKTQAALADYLDGLRKQSKVIVYLK